MYNNLFFNYIFIDGIVRKLQPLYINNEEVFEVHTLFLVTKIWRKQRKACSCYEQPQARFYYFTILNSEVKANSPIALNLS